MEPWHRGFQNGIAAPVLYTSATQVAALCLTRSRGTTAQVSVTYRGEIAAEVAPPFCPPSLFTSNQTGTGYAAAVNAADGTVIRPQIRWKVARTFRSM